MHTRHDPAGPTRTPLLHLVLLELLVGTTLAILATGCSDSSSPNEPQPFPVVWSWAEPGALTVSLRYLMPTSAPDCIVDSVTVTGPGLASPRKLNCTGSKGVSFTGDVDVSLAPPPLPSAYTFRVTLGGKTSNQVAEVDCYLPVPTGVAPAPGATVSSPVTLGWTLGPGPGLEYSVAVFRGGVKQAEGVVTDQNSMGFTLAAGSYQWTVSAAPKGLYDGSSTRRCGAKWDDGSFTVN